MILIKNIIFYLIGLIPTSFQKRNVDFSERALFVHLSHPLGDFISRINFIRSIENDISKESNFLVLDEKYKQIAHLIDSKIKIIFINRKKYQLNPYYRFNILRILTSLKFRFALNISVDRGMMSDEITLNSGADRRITLQKENHFLSSLFEKTNNSKYSDILSLNSYNEYDRMDELQIVLNKQFGFTFKERIFKYGSKQKGEYIVVAPFSSRKLQSWPIENYIELIKKLKTFTRVILIGQLTNVSSRILLKIPENITNLISKTELNEVSEIIRESSLFIGNDSGLTHLAYFFNVPLIGIIGGGNFSQFFPTSNVNSNRFLFNPLDCFNCNWNCRYVLPYCLTEVTVDSVYHSALELLNK